MIPPSLPSLQTRCKSLTTECFIKGRDHLATPPKKKNGGCTLCRNTVRTLHSPSGTRNLKFRSSSPCTKDILYTGFEDLRTFWYVFMSVVKVFVRYEFSIGHCTSRHLCSFRGLTRCDFTFLVCTLYSIKKFSFACM